VTYDVYNETERKTDFTSQSSVLKMFCRTICCTNDKKCYTSI